MSQEDVLKILEENKGWMITGEIMEILNESRSAINNVLRRLYKQNEVIKNKIITRKGVSTLWKIKEKED